MDTGKVLLYHLQSLYLTRGLSLMKLFFLFSLTICSHLPKCLSSFCAVLLYLSLLLCTLCSPFSFVPICPFHICSLLFHLWRLSFRSLPPPRLTSHPISLCSFLPKVDYRTEDGTANAGSDYEFAEGTLLFKPGETLKGKNNSHSRNRWTIFKTCHWETSAPYTTFCSGFFWRNYFIARLVS